MNRDPDAEAHRLLSRLARRGARLARAGNAYRLDAPGQARARLRRRHGTRQLQGDPGVVPVEVRHDGAGPQQGQDEPESVHGEH